MIERRFALAVLLFLAAFAIVPSLRADDAGADAIAALRLKIEQQAAQVEALRAELVRLEAELRGTQSVPAPAPAPAPPPAPPAAPAATVKFGGLLQTWYASGDAGFSDTFRIRRSELKVSGELAKKYLWVLMIDPAKTLTLTSGTVNQASRVLQDAFITVPIPHGAILQVGQYRVPLSREGLDSASELDTVERALFISDRARGGTYGDIRDIGVTLRGTLGGRRYDYNVGVFNGSGESQNDTDRGDGKALIGRFVASLPGGLRAGASGAWGGQAGTARRDRLGGELFYTRRALRLAAELMTGKDGPLDRRGYYLNAAYRFRPRVEDVVFRPHLEGVVRIDAWDPDTSRDAGLAAANETDYIVGFNYNPFPKLRLQANAIHKTFSDGALKDRNLLLVNLQTSW